MLQMKVSMLPKVSLFFTFAGGHSCCPVKMHTVTAVDLRILHQDLLCQYEKQTEVWKQISTIHLWLAPGKGRNKVRL